MSPKCQVPIKTSPMENSSSIKPWEVISETSVRVGFRTMLRRSFRLPDGREDEYTLKKEGNPVCILAVTEDNAVVLVRQFRPGPMMVLDELPGGGMEPGENPEEAAERELLEETGYAGQVSFIGTSLMCGYSTGLRYNFVATGCRRVTNPKPDQNEFLEVVTIPLEQFRTHLRSGELTDVTTGYLGLDFLGLL